MFFNKREQILLITAGSIVLGAIIITRLLIPFLQKWPEQTNQIEQKSALIKRSQALIEQTDALNNEFSSLSKRIQAKLSPSAGENEFLTELGKVAQESSVHIETMDPGPLRDLGFFNEFSVEINMETNLGNLVRFLYQIRKSSVVLVANQLRLKPKSERSALLKGNLLISTIFLK